MNRQQRRALSAPKEPTYTLTKSQIDTMKKETTDEAVDLAFKLMLCIPAMVIHDNFKDIMKREGRIETFIELVLDLYDSYTQGGLIELSELEECLLEEAGVSFEEIRKKHKLC